MMRQSHRSWHQLLIFLCLAFLATPAFALPTLSISSPGSDGVFVLRGDQMDGVTGLDLSVGYDAATLGTPRVTMGAMVQGMMSAANPGNPVRIAVVGTRSLTGSGVIATIAFDRTGTSPGIVTSVSATLIDGSGKKVSMAQPLIANPVAVVAVADSTSGAPQTGEGKNNDVPINIVLPRTNMVGGTVTMPGQESDGGQAGVSPTPLQEAPPAVKKRLRSKQAQAEGEEPPLEREESPPPPADENGAAPGAATPPEPQKLPQPVKISSVLNRFKEFKGERTAANLTALFRAAAPVPYRQNPPIALADGKSVVTLVIGMSTGTATPSFTFTDCTYVSHNRTEAGWEIQARPKRDVVSASITMLYSGLSQEFPLTVAPRVPLVSGKSRTVKESDFERFLKERGTATHPRLDLNRDGRRDYVDDYIYAANYLAQGGAKAP